MSKKIFIVSVFALLACGAFLALAQDAPPRKGTIILATTTSVQDTGLLDALIPAFEKSGQYTVKTVAVGSGQAMQLGRQGEADLLLVHSPDDEKQFMADGFGTDRTTFMHNDFVILGPAEDPAGIKGVKSAAAAFSKIAASGRPFVSRADLSGTHRREQKLWAAAKSTPTAANYIEAGQGMAATLKIASEKNAYILSDRSTFLTQRKILSLVLLCEGDDALINRYSLILINTAKFPKVNAAGARALYDFILSSKGKKIVDGFGREKFGKPLFYYDYKAK